MAKIRYPEKEKELRKKIENVTGITPHTPYDFDALANNIQMRTQESVSATTLKRFWKYIDKDSNSKTRNSVLDVLAHFVGYTSWDAFCCTQDMSDCSDFIVTQEIKISELAKGTLVRIVWDPERSITARCEGANMMTITESVNSKLSVNDTFYCCAIVDSLPLLLTNVKHEGMPSCCYICGKMGGVKATVLE